jgi:hypothetical protein
MLVVGCRECVSGTRYPVSNVDAHLDDRSWLNDCQQTSGKNIPLRTSRRYYDISGFGVAYVMCQLSCTDSTTRHLPPKPDLWLQSVYLACHRQRPLLPSQNISILDGCTVSWSSRQAHISYPSFSPMFKTLETWLLLPQSYRDLT